jgi:Mrp family chromosome partitioning ATPase
LLAELGQQYERVIVDSPPIVAVTDALILTSVCDVTVLVLRAEKSMRRVSMQARDSLAGVEAHVLGVVVNDVPRKGDRYGYYGSYSYYGRGENGGNGRAKTKQRTAVDNDRSRRGRKQPRADKLRAGLIPEAAVTSEVVRIGETRRHETGR